MIAKTLWNRRVRMRDGVELAADVALPGESGAWPAVVIRTPYMRGRTLREPESFMRLVDYGYALVVVDVRGRGDSDGKFELFVADCDDGYDTIEWVAGQSWCTGHVGMVGVSYEGLTQWWTAKARPPHLDCIAPAAVGAALPPPDAGERLPAPPLQYWLWWFNLVTGRTVQHPSSPSWEANWYRLPARDLDQWVGTAREWWPRFVAGEIDYLGPKFALVEEDWEELRIPVLVTVGWWDDHSTMSNWLALQRSPAGVRSHLLIGAWDHQGNEGPRPTLGGLDVTASAIDTIEYTERFLALHLKPREAAAEPLPRCRIFRTGSMEWEEPREWPAPECRPESWYLSEGGLLSAEVAAEPGSAGYEYDPTHPFSDFSNLDDFAWSDPPLDERYIGRRRDTLVFRSEEFSAPLTVSGQAWFQGFVSVDQPSTDVAVKLFDVHPDGRWIVHGALLLPPPIGRLPVEDDPDSWSRPREVSIPLVWLHHRFLPGHRIAVAITSSFSPPYARNLNSGEPWADAVEPRIARVAVHFGSGRESRLILPVEPQGPDEVR